MRMIARCPFNDALEGVLRVAGDAFECSESRAALLAGLKLAVPAADQGAEAEAPEEAGELSAPEPEAQPEEAGEPAAEEPPAKKRGKKPKTAPDEDAC